MVPAQALIIQREKLDLKNSMRFCIPVTGKLWYNMMVSGGNSFLSWKMKGLRINLESYKFQVIFQEGKLKEADMNVSVLIDRQ